MKIEDAYNELVVMQAKILEGLQAERRVVMEKNVYDREYEKALRKYDELTIRNDQLRQVFEVLDRYIKTNNVTA